MTSLAGDTGLSMLLRLLISLVLMQGISGVSRADIPLPPSVMNPATLPEAWNIIRLTRANVSRLLEEDRLAEVAEQISLCSPALRRIATAEVSDDKRKTVDSGTSKAFQNVNSVAQSAMVRSKADAGKAFLELQSALDSLETAFDAADINAEIYFCPTHPEVITTTAGERCRKCSESLRIRRIPYSFIQVIPGDTVRLALDEEGEFVEGQSRNIKAQLTTKAGLPLSPTAFLINHNSPVHLLIVDPKLEDFQFVLPAADTMPGNYQFPFTPMIEGPHRVWADIVPIDTGIQEFPFADMGGVFKEDSPLDKTESSSVSVGGFTFSLSFMDLNEGQLRARQIQLMRIHIADASGQPVSRLEPINQAYAHIFGFYGDMRTVLRLHPTGGNILSETQRGGPALGFKIYPPKTGFIRFFCIFRIDDRMITVPFNVNVT